MSDERVFHVFSGTAVAATPIDLAQAGFRERDDLQEWVISHPEILGEQVKILTTEYDRWESRAGERYLNRLDVLGIDVDGRLVLAELKRDRAPDMVQLQAINYAALVATLKPSDLVELYKQHRSSQGDDLAIEQAEQEIVEHCGELDEEILNSPRIVLVASTFSAVTTTTVDWLTKQGLDITLQQVQAYRISTGEKILTVSQLYPLAVVEDLLVSPRRTAFQEKQARATGRREASTVVKIIKAGALADGTALRLEPTNEVTQEVRDRIASWVSEKPSRAEASWLNDRKAPIVWAEDGQTYKPTTLVKKVILEATGNPRASIAGPRWFITQEGRTLPAIAGQQTGKTFDWGILHDLLEQIPPGRWTSYGDLAALIGTAAQPLGNHLATCDLCVNAWRVLDGNGRSTQSFAWLDPDREETQEEVLTSEGVAFDLDGKADASLRLSAEELGELLSENEE